MHERLGGLFRNQKPGYDRAGIALLPGGLVAAQRRAAVSRPLPDSSGAREGSFSREFPAEPISLFCLWGGRQRARLGSRDGSLHGSRGGITPPRISGFWPGKPDRAKATGYEKKNRQLAVGFLSNLGPPA